MALTYRPHYRWSADVRWQAHCGAEPIGPAREFQATAVRDFPPEAKARFLPLDTTSSNDCTHIETAEPYRLAPVTNPGDDWERGASTRSFVAR